MTPLDQVEAVARREAISTLGCLAYERVRNGPPEEAWSKYHVQQVDLCRDFIRSASTKLLPNRGWSKRGSYGLKHDVERQSGVYIQNGSFIVAAFLEGLDVKRDGINAVFRRSCGRS